MIGLPSTNRSASCACHSTVVFQFVRAILLTSMPMLFDFSNKANTRLLETIKSVVIASYIIKCNFVFRSLSVLAF